MTKGNLIFNSITIIALAVLFFLHFTQEEKQITTESVSSPKSTIEVKVDAENKETGIDKDIVYVDLQKLLIEYKLSEQLNIDFIKRKGILQEQLDSQVKQYEKDAIAFQDKLKRGNFLNQTSAENQQNTLLKRQQELQQLQYNLEDQLLTEQQTMNIVLYDSVINYLNEYNKSHNHQFILSKIDGSNLLVANPNLNITDTIIKVLNIRYEDK